jgi:hypothetical protein
MMGQMVKAHTYQARTILGVPQIPHVLSVSRSRSHNPPIRRLSSRFTLLHRVPYLFFESYVLNVSRLQGGHKNVRGHLHFFFLFYSSSSLPLFSRYRAAQA